MITDSSAGHTINALAGADYVKGMGGVDTLNGGGGNDLLDGGSGNDKLNGNNGIDLVTFASGTTAVVLDLSTNTDTAKRGTETDTLTGIEGAIGSGKADTGRASANWFQGGLGKDTFTGGGGRDLYDFNAVAESGITTTTHDVITDFAHLTDEIDLMGIDADSTVAGNQAFRWVGSAAFTGTPGELGYFSSGGDTIIRASTDNDSPGEFQIRLTGMKALTVDDFFM